MIENGIKFASLNKNKILREYKVEVFKKSDYNTERVAIHKFAFVDRAEHSKLANNLLNKNEIWEQIGGSSLPDNIQKEYGIDKLEHM